MAKDRHGEELRLIARLKSLEELRSETREELDWIEEDIRAGTAAEEDLRYVHTLAEERLDRADVAKEEVEPGTGKVLRVCFVGDSITIGTGDGLFQGWPGRLCERAWEAGHDITGYNLGIRADTSRLIASRWRAECAARLPEDVPAALVFGFGVNDTAEEPETGVRVPLDDSVAAARSILAEAKGWHHTLWIGPAPVAEDRQPVTPRPGVSYDFRNERVAAYNAAYTELAAELALPYLDLFTPLSEDERWADDLASGDGVHPSADGYDILADLIEAWAGWRGLFK